MNKPIIPSSKCFGKLNDTWPPIITPINDPHIKGKIQAKFILLQFISALKKLEFAWITAWTGITAVGFIKYTSAVIVITPPPKPNEEETPEAQKLTRQSITNPIIETSGGSVTIPKPKNISDTSTI